MQRITADWLTSDASQTVCAMLTGAGFQAYFVGGCVRNALLGVPGNDLDIATDALPEKVMALAGDAGLRAIPTGVEHGTVTIVVDDVPYEITTYRRDVETDGRRAVVAFAADIADDARRRDFTMNALYAAPDGTIADPLGGLPDLTSRRVRFIEDPAQRIREDYLRILRFFRFFAYYGDPNGGIDPDGLAACAAHVAGLETLSAERVGQEMRKLLAAPDPSPAMAAMAASGVLLRVMPGALPDRLPVLVHLEQSLGVAPDPIRRLAVLGGEDLRDRLRLSNAGTQQLAHLRAAVSVAELAYRHGAAIAVDRHLVDCATMGQPVDAATLAQIERAAQAVFPLKAADLMPAISGPALGQALKTAEARWIASGFTLDKADLID